MRTFFYAGTYGVKDYSMTEAMACNTNQEAAAVCVFYCFVSIFDTGHCAVAAPVSDILSC